MRCNRGRGRSWLRDPMLKVVCPACGGLRCKCPSGHVAAELHAGRDIAANRDACTDNAPPDPRQGSRV